MQKNPNHNNKEESRKVRGMYLHGYTPDALASPNRNITVTG